MFKRLATATILSGVLMTGAGGALASGAAHAATAPNAHHRVTAAAPVRAHRRHVQQVRRALRHALRVTAVSGDTINAVTRADQPVTITVGTATTFKEPGKTASLSDVQPGELILVQGTRTAPRAIQAKVVRILFARMAGVVTAVNGSSLTVTGVGGAQRTVQIAATTAITRAGVAATAGDITPNTAILAAGTLNADSSLTAARIVIRAAHVAGKVTTVSGATITIQGAYGTTYNVTTSSGTVYATRQGRALSPATAGDVTVGRRIVAYGTRSADGASFAAFRIVLRPVATATHS